MSNNNTAIKAPEYSLHRDVSGVDTVSSLSKSHGVNMSGYEKAHIQIVPAGGGDPSVEVYFWSEGASKWIRSATPLAQAGTGADESYEFTINCEGRIILVAFTTLAAGTAKAYVSGFNREFPG